MSKVPTYFIFMLLVMFLFSLVFEFITVGLYAAFLPALPVFITDSWNLTHTSSLGIVLLANSGWLLSATLTPEGSLARSLAKLSMSLGVLLKAGVILVSLAWMFSWAMKLVDPTAEEALFPGGTQYAFASLNIIIASISLFIIIRVMRRPASQK